MAPDGCFWTVRDNCLWCNSISHNKNSFIMQHWTFNVRTYTLYRIRKTRNWVLILFWTSRQECLVPRAYLPKCSVHGPVSSVQSPASRVQSPESRVQGFWYATLFLFVWIKIKLLMIKSITYVLWENLLRISNIVGGKQK